MLLLFVCYSFVTRLLLACYLYVICLLLGIFELLIISIFTDSYNGVLAR